MKWVRMIKYTIVLYKFRIRWMVFHSVLLGPYATPLFWFTGSVLFQENHDFRSYLDLFNNIFCLHFFCRQNRFKQKVTKKRQPRKFDDCWNIDVNHTIVWIQIEETKCVSPWLVRGGGLQNMRLQLCGDFSALNFVNLLGC